MLEVLIQRFLYAAKSAKIMLTGVLTEAPFLILIAVWRYALGCKQILKSESCDYDLWCIAANIIWIGLVACYAPPRITAREDA